MSKRQNSNLIIGIISSLIAVLLPISSINFVRRHKNLNVPATSFPEAEVEIEENNDKGEKATVFVEDSKSNSSNDSPIENSTKNTSKSTSVKRQSANSAKPSSKKKTSSKKSTTTHSKPITSNSPTESGPHVDNANGSWGDPTGDPGGNWDGGENEDE